MPRRSTISTLSAATAATCAGAATSHALPPPRYDHVVVVVLENINNNEIINSPSAPYLNMLATQGTALPNAYGLIHTSAPNYGELFAGDHNGIVDSGVSPGVPLTTANLGAELRQRGLTFAGYAQSMPSVGYTGLASGQYVRGHNPWVNWQNDAADADPNQLPSSLNRPFTLFPTGAAGFAQLPTVSFVTPDNDNNMHNGSTLADRLTRGDNFVKNNLDGYYQWAKANNSLLIVTADEDDRSQNVNLNKIPTIFAGANVKAAGTAAASYTLHNVLRTIEDMYALPHAAASSFVRPVAGVFAGDAAVNIKSFQAGTSGYNASVDIQIKADAPSTAFAATTPLSVSLDSNTGVAGNQPVQTLIRFDSITGTNSGQIPSDATVLSAKLKLWTTAGSGTTATPIHLHRMLQNWDEPSTWNSVGGGIAADDVKAASATDFSYAPKVADEPFFFDVSDTVQKWLDGAPNFGWAILPTGADDYQFNSEEAVTLAQRPLLEVAYALYPRFIATGGSWNTAGNWANGLPNAAAAVGRFLSRTAAASITLDGAKTVGALIFDSPNAYTINPGSGGTLTLANYGNVTSITLKQGQHTLAVPLNLVDPAVVDIAGGGGQLNATAGVTLAAGRSLNKTGAGVFNVAGGLALNAGSAAVVDGGELRASTITGAGSLVVHAGASAKLTGASSTASKITSLTLDGASDAWTGKLDVGVSGFVLDYTGASPLGTIANQIKAARAAGGSGNGIGSSAAAADPTGAVGVGEASVVLGLAAGQTGTFLGQPVDATALLVRYTKNGDATLDGKVNFADLVTVAQNYDGAPGAGGWARGDFDYDGVVGFSDLTVIAQNYDSSLAGSAAFASDLQAAFAQANTPEPALLGLLGTAFAMAGRRLSPRRRANY